MFPLTPSYIFSPPSLSFSLSSLPPSPSPLPPSLSPSLSLSESVFFLLLYLRDHVIQICIVCIISSHSETSTKVEGVKPDGPQEGFNGSKNVSFCPQVTHHIETWGHVDANLDIGLSHAPVTITKFSASTLDPYTIPNITLTLNLATISNATLTLYL